MCWILTSLQGLHRLRLCVCLPLSAPAEAAQGFSTLLFFLCCHLSALYPPSVYLFVSAVCFSSLCFCFSPFVLSLLLCFLKSFLSSLLFCSGFYLFFSLLSEFLCFSFLSPSSFLVFVFSTVFIFSVFVLWSDSNPFRLFFSCLYYLFFCLSRLFSSFPVYYDFL